MTIKAIAEVAGVSRETVRLIGKDLYPERFEKGKRTSFTQPQAIQIMGKLRKKGFIEPLTQNKEVLTQNKEVVGKTYTSNEISSLVAIVNNLVTQNKDLIGHILQNNSGTTNKSISKTTKQVKSSVKNPNRSKLNKLVSRIATEFNLKNGEVWTKLYKQLENTVGISIESILYQNTLENTYVSAIDILEEKGLLLNCIVISLEWLNSKTNDNDISIEAILHTYDT